MKANNKERDKPQEKQVAQLSWCTPLHWQGMRIWEILDLVQALLINS